MDCLTGCAKWRWVVGSCEWQVVWLSHCVKCIHLWIEVMWLCRRCICWHISEEKLVMGTRPLCLQNLVNIQPPCSTLCSSLLTIAHPPTSPLLWIMIILYDVLHLVCGTSFLFLSIYFIPISLSLTYLFLRLSHYFPLLIHHSSSVSVTPSLFHFRLKTYLFHKSFSQKTMFLLQAWLHGLSRGLYLLSCTSFCS